MKEAVFSQACNRQALSIDQQGQKGHLYKRMLMKAQGSATQESATRICGRKEAQVGQQDVNKKGNNKQSEKRARWAMTGRKLANQCAVHPRAAWEWCLNFHEKSSRAQQTRQRSTGGHGSRGWGDKTKNNHCSQKDSCMTGAKDGWLQYQKNTG